jgi:SAM-dependent methyltransferase
MEHLPESKLVLAELSRVLKPGGKMIYTDPLFFEEHEQPFDFYRYTQFGLRYLFGSTGFVVERLGWRGILGRSLSAELYVALPRTNLVVAFSHAV